MNQKALESTQTAISNDFGNISDLPEELQNSIANIYYNAAIIAQNQNLLESDNKNIEDQTFYLSSIKSLPRIISTYRKNISSREIESEIKLITEIILFTFKYRIKNVTSKSYFHLKILSFFRRGKVNEIPSLHKRISGQVG